MKLHGNFFRCETKLKLYASKTKHKRVELESNLTPKVLSAVHDYGGFPVPCTHTTIPTRCLIDRQQYGATPSELYLFARCSLQFAEKRQRFYLSIQWRSKLPYCEQDIPSTLAREVYRICHQHWQRLGVLYIALTWKLRRCSLYSLTNKSQSSARSPIFSWSTNNLRCYILGLTALAQLLRIQYFSWLRNEKRAYTGTWIIAVSESFYEITWWACTLLGVVS